MTTGRPQSATGLRLESGSIDPFPDAWTPTRSSSNSAKPRLARQPQGPLAKVLAFILSAAFLVLAFMFSLVALAVVAVLGVALGGWLWWKTRACASRCKSCGKPATPTWPVAATTSSKGNHPRSRPERRLLR
jgi:hypothetical protein